VSGLTHRLLPPDQNYRQIIGLSVQISWRKIWLRHLTTWMDRRNYLRASVNSPHIGPISAGQKQGAACNFGGYAPNGGGFDNYLGALRTRAFIRGNGDTLTITEAGIEALGSWEPLPTGLALIDYWRGRLGKAEGLILETLTQVFPDALTKEEVAAKAGYEANGGGFNNALGRLRTLELVQGRGEIKASDNLFEAW
jgi:hypothetical protein